MRLIDASQASIDKGLKFADKLLEKDVSKGRISQEDAAATRERLMPSTQLEDLSDVDFVIEAVPVRSPNLSPDCVLTLPSGNTRPKVEHLRAARENMSLTRYSRYEHILDIHYEDRRCNCQ